MQPNNKSSPLTPSPGAQADSAQWRTWATSTVEEPMLPKGQGPLLSHPRHTCPPKEALRYPQPHPSPLFSHFHFPSIASPQPPLPWPRPIRSLELGSPQPKALAVQATGAARSSTPAAPAGTDRPPCRVQMSGRPSWSAAWQAGASECGNIRTGGPTVWEMGEAGVSGWTG